MPEFHYHVGTYNKRGNLVHAEGRFTSEVTADRAREAAKVEEETFLAGEYARMRARIDEELAESLFDEVDSPDPTVPQWRLTALPRWFYHVIKCPQGDLCAVGRAS